VSPPQVYTTPVISTSEEGAYYLADLEAFKATAGLDTYFRGESVQLKASGWAYPVVSSDMRLEQRFNNLARKWKRETVNLSSIQQIVLHQAYQEIIAMGSRAIPLILNRLEKEPDFWFWALRSLTGANPVTEEIRGDVIAMTKAWLDWGRKHAYL